MTHEAKRCSFCGKTHSAELPLITGTEGHICGACAKLAAQVFASWGSRRAIDGPAGKPPVPMEIKQRLDRYIIGQDAAKEVLSVAVYNHYKRLAAENDLPASPLDESAVEISKANILLLGPSGTGKTLLASTLARIVGMPFVMADATTLTQAGYIGEDVESIIARLLDAADGNRELAEWGIVYIDEIDKLARVGESSHGVRDVSGEGMQQALLKLVEGTQVRLPAKGRRRETASPWTHAISCSSPAGCSSGWSASWKSAWRRAEGSDSMRRPLPVPARISRTTACPTRTIFGSSG